MRSHIITRKGDIIEDIHGFKVADPYRWLENGEDPEVLRWTEEQNKKTDASLRGKEFDTFSEELVRNFHAVEFSVPVGIKGRYFYLERKPGEDQSVLYFKQGLDGEPIVVVNPNGLSKRNTTSLDYWYPSRTGKYVVYGLSRDGDEMATLYVKDLDADKILGEVIPNCRHSDVRWLPDDSGFYYTRNPRPGTVPKNEEHLHYKLYFHVLGADPNNDEMIFGEDRPKDDMFHSLILSLDGEYLAIHVSGSWEKNDVFVYRRSTKETIQVIQGISAKSYLRFLGDQVLLGTNYSANNYRVLVTSRESITDPIEKWKEFIPEREYPLVSLRLSADKILAIYLVNISSKVILFDYSGKEIGELPLPPYATLEGMSAFSAELEFFYGVASFTFPKIVYHYDPKTQGYSVYRTTENPIDPSQYIVKQEWCTSRDGTKIPSFVFHRKDIVLNGTTPTILYGYGGFAVSQHPSFMKNWVPWIERGGIFVVANIRGGGEFGENWHQGGVRKNKQRSFDDFIAVSEYLINQKYTDSHHLGILGGSNGGLLVTAVAMQRPELYKAVCSRVPLTDMVRFSKFGMAIRWIHEYGNPDIPEELKNILGWSPYHNVKEKVYASFLFTTGIKDSRVDPLHSRKMTAILQATDSPNRVLLFTEMEAGHGMGKPVTKIIEGQAFIITFFSQELGLDC